MKIDLHIHTRHSEDSVNRAEDIILTAKKRGLDGIAITDHNTVKGWKEAREVSKKYKFPVVFGEEIRVRVGREYVGEILGLFLTEEVRTRHPMEVIDEIKSQGGIAVVAHPFDKRRGFRDLENIAGIVHGLEVINARVSRVKYNLEALRAAARYNLARTGGSDAHTIFEVGRAYTVADTDTLEGFRKAILKRKTWAVGRRSSFLVHGASLLARIRNLGR